MHTEINRIIGSSICRPGGDACRINFCHDTNHVFYQVTCTALFVMIQYFYLMSIFIVGGNFLRDVPLVERVAGETPG